MDNTLLPQAMMGLCECGESNETGRPPGCLAVSLFHLNRPPPRHLQHNPRHIIRQPRRQKKHRTCSLLRRPRPTQRNEHRSKLAQLIRYTESNLLTITLYLLSTLLRGRQARLNKTEAHTVDLHIVTPPLLRQRLRQPRNASLRSRVVHLP